ncbi:MAG: hypothetical protein JSS75_08165 [Bacteroidetes bacterium]|nr:hypothetical protein [Bacteroidota bacterium]
MEDRIIEYLDGGLTPDARAALLREVRRSPHATELLEHHRMLRSLAKTSVHSVHAPLLTSAAFEAIASSTPSPIPSTRRKRTVGIATLAVLLIGTIVTSSLLLRNGTDRSLGSLHTASIGSTSIPDYVDSHSDRNIASSSSIDAVMPSQSVPTHTKKLDDPSIPLEVIAARSNSEGIGPDVVQIPVVNLAAMSDVGSITTERAHDLVTLRQGERREERDRFEATLQTSSGFTTPADAQPIKPFAEQRLGIGYFITRSNVIGVRVTSGLYQLPGSVVSMKETGVTVLQQALETRRAWGGEVYAAHHFTGLFNTPVTALIGASAGFIPNGYTVAAEAGVRIPASEHFDFAVDFSLSRVHSNIGGADAVLSNASVANAPVLFSGTGIRTTLNGSIHYGIQYRF